MRVLLVEDTEIHAQTISALLRHEGCAVDVVTDGVAAVAAATAHPYDAIVLDLLLPGMSGYRVCETLRTQGCHTPILVLTAKVVGDDEVAEVLDAGADDYLPKVTSGVVLAARIRALLRRGPARSTPVVRVGDLVIDPAGRRCRWRDTPIELTPREFALLHYLAIHQGSTIGKDELLEHVWEKQRADTNNVHVYIGYLRRKIDQRFGTHFIQTAHGHGYRLAAVGS